MSLSNNQKKFGRVTYDDVPKILQNDSTRTQSRKKCLMIKGTSPTLSPAARDRKIGYHHKTITGMQLIKDTGTVTRIMVGAGQHNFQVNPLALGSNQYSVGDIANAEIEVAIFCTGFMDDIIRTTADDFLNFYNTNVNTALNDQSYQNGLDDLVKRGVQGYIRYNAVVRQLWHDPSITTDDKLKSTTNNFVINSSDYDQSVVGVSIGESKAGGIQPFTDSGYIWRPLEFMSLHALNYKMGLHAYTMMGKINTDITRNSASPVPQVVDREGYCMKEGYMGIDANPRTATVDLQIQQQQQNIHTIPIKLDPDRFDPSKPFVIEVKGFIYIPHNSDITPSSGKTLDTNTNYPLALVPGPDRYSEGNALDLGVDSEMGLNYDGSVNGEEWYMSLPNIIYNVCGMTVWANT